MKTASLPRSISSSFFSLACVAVCCIAFLCGLSAMTLRGILLHQSDHARSFVPAKRLTGAFERETLNARIFFIYFVTIQKPGSLENGWARFHNAEAKVAELSDLVNREEALRDLRGPVAKLRADVANYRVALAATLSMVQSGELHGPHYDAQVKEWAARGAVMVGDAGSVEVQCFNAGEADTNSTLDIVRSGLHYAVFAFVGSSLLCLVIAFLLMRRVKSLATGADAGAAVPSAI